MANNSSNNCPPGPRQAVVLIHGIGEQRPMATLRSFVDAFLQPGGYHSKPDQLSDSFELRRIKLRRARKCDGDAMEINAEWPETDFYEYYWAHQMYGTTTSHVVAWLVQMMCNGCRIARRAPAAYQRLRRMALFAWTLAVIVLGLLGAVTWFFWQRPEMLPSAPAAGGGALGLFLLYYLWRALRFLPAFGLSAFLDFVGDAARYFDVNPKNVARRHDILRGGVDLLKKLHEERDERADEVLYRYGRIVLVGHSLGSVIAYDILRHYWSEVNGRIDMTGTDLADVENFRATSLASFPDAAPYAKPKRFRLAQHRLWKYVSQRVPAAGSLKKDALWRKRLRAEAGARSELAGAEPPRDWQPARWIVSDLVTLGSPLAHAPALLARGTGELRRKIRLRELPTCPPDRSRHLNRGHFLVKLKAEAERLDSYWILHHGACFALTRWTNFWYPNDPVGGPLQAPFGKGIDDVCLPNASCWPLLSHLRYWHRRQGGDWWKLKDILIGRG